MSLIFEDREQTYDVPSYSSIYGVHPSRFVFNTHGAMEYLTRDLDPNTGVSWGELAARRRKLQPDVSRRVNVLRRAIEEGAAWEPSNAQLLDEWENSHLPVCKLAVKKKFQKARVGVRQAKKFERLVGSGDVLSSEEQTLCRAIAARANYLSLDRPDIQFATKELCRGFACPNRRDYDKLRRLGRYLLGAPRMVWTFAFQDHESELDTMKMYTDTDFAGCPTTRRSTSGGVTMRGRHCIRAYSKTQTTVCLSSAEAELGGIVTAASQGLGLQSMAGDLGLTWKLDLLADASAAIGICRRRGLGKVRHLHVADLWVQDKLKAGAFSLTKWPGSENLADLLTKYLDRATMEKTPTGHEHQERRWPRELGAVDCKSS